MAQGPYRPRHFNGLQAHGRSHRRTIHVDMGMQDHIPALVRIDIGRLAHLGQVNLAIHAPMVVGVLMMVIRSHIFVMMLRPHFMRMRLRPGRRSEPGKHGNQYEFQNAMHHLDVIKEHLFKAVLPAMVKTARSETIGPA